MYKEKNIDGLEFGMLWHLEKGKKSVRIAGSKENECKEGADSAMENCWSHLCDCI